MTPKQALEILDKATAGIALNRADHALIARALSVLTDFVAEASSRPEMPKPGQLVATKK